MAGTGVLEGRSAIVTGASRGIGRAIARRLAAEGAAVCVTGRTAHPGEHPLPGSLDETVAEIRETGGTAVAVTADLADPAFDRRRIVDAARDAFGAPVEILVNNAAAPRTFDVDLEHTTRDVFMEAVNVNAWAAWELSALVIPGMRERGRGWIVNVSSVSAGPKVGPPFPPSQVGAQVLYGATKAMLDRITTGAAMELFGDHIAVNSLAPEAAILTENASTLITVPQNIVEPVETFAEATLALCTGDPAVLTGRVATSLSLLVELRRPVRTLDGHALLPGWQPDEIDRARLRPSYLRAMEGERS
ncbi:MAG TPA: SDR family NAD(P)-dependent oxidoreductase [Acidimicrobiia bacterium]|nr:SDR family NAD(P)-dependent oxidoreductase [Acidimicrobiia bacterium]